MKATFNPAIEWMLTRAFAVDQYADIFERIALSEGRLGGLAPLWRRHIAPDVAAAPLLFIHVPKNGGTSLKRALYESDPGHVTLRYYERFLPETLSRMPTLAILRNPIDRFLSGYDFLLQGGGGDVRIQPRIRQKMRSIQSVDMLLDFLEEAGDDWLKIDTFLRPQWWYVTNKNGDVAISHLWLMDATDRMEAWLRPFGVGSLPHSNRTERRDRELTAAQRARVERLYAPDFTLYDSVRRLGGYVGSMTDSPLSSSTLRTTASTAA